MSAAAGGADATATADRSPRRADPLAGVVFAVLIVACFVAFFVTQRLKHTPTDVQRFELTPFFSPTPTGRHKLEEISFKLAHAERVTATIIDSRGDVVATLLRNHPVARYKQLSLRWNGRRGAHARYRHGVTAAGHGYLVVENTGARAADGEYRVRLQLSGQPSPILSPHSFTLVAR